MGTHSLENPSSFQIPAQPTVSSAPGVVGLLLTPVSSQLVHQLCPLLLGVLGLLLTPSGTKGAASGLRPGPDLLLGSLDGRPWSNCMPGEPVGGAGKVMVRDRRQE